jgi:hypothetical protein
MLGAMGMEVSGKLYKIFDAQQVTERFRKREFVVLLEESSRFPQYVMFQLTHDRCENLDGFDEGDSVRVEFSLRGREWKSPQGEMRYFNSLDVWTISADGAGGGGFRDDDEPPPPEEPPPGMDEIPF